MKLAKLIKMRTLIDRIRPFTRKMSEKQENDANFLEGNSVNENDAQKCPKKEDDIIVPEISQNED